MIQNALLSANAEHTKYVEEIVSAMSYSTLSFMLEYTQ